MLELFISSKKKYLIGFLIFLIIYFFVYITISSLNYFDFKGKWITIPDYQNKVLSKKPIVKFYSRLASWDGQWYYHIAKYGYQCDNVVGSNNPNNCNLTFFPFLPLAGNFIHNLTGIPLYCSMQIINQLLFLAIILIFINYAFVYSNNDPATGILSILLFCLYPGSIYYFTAYSEPMLSFFIVIVFFLSFKCVENFSFNKIWLIYLVSFLAAIVKVTGMFVSFIPLIVMLAKRFTSGKDVFKAKYYVFCPTVGITSLSSFLLFSHYRFGKWNLYFEAVHNGWQISPDEAFLTLNPLIIVKTFTLDYFLSIDLSNIIIVFFPIILAVIFLYLAKNFKTNYHVLSLFIYLIGLYYFHAVLTNSENSYNRDLMRHLIAYIPMLSLVVLSINWKRKLILNIILLIFVIIQGFFFSRMVIFFGMGLWVS